MESSNVVVFVVLLQLFGTWEKNKISLLASVKSYVFFQNKSLGKVLYMGRVSSFRV